jgi:formate-dependent nitrite reductase membrane component NrfD
MVPDARFTSYYGRPIVRPAPWSADIPAYLFFGGLAAGGSLLAAGADITRRPALRKVSRATALGSVAVSFAALVHDLGRPARFHHMLRVAKTTSPMSMGTWLLSAYGPLVGAAALSELADRLPGTDHVRQGGRAAGLLAAGLAPAVASYTAVLLSDTATPTWHAARHDLPFVFTGSAAAAAGGAAMLLVPLDEVDVARRMAIAGAVTDLTVTRRIEKTIGLPAEPLHQSRAGTYMKASKALTAAGAVLAGTVARHNRAASGAAGLALLAGSWCARFGIFHAGQQSAQDPRYTVVPQRQRLDAAGHTDDTKKTRT